MGLGCLGITRSAETKLHQHITKLIVLSKKSSSYVSNEGLGLEDSFRKELKEILDIAKSEKSLPPTMFHDLICSLDDISLSHPDIATKIITLSNAARKVIRKRTLGIGYDDKEMEDDNENLQATLHIIQKNISASGGKVETKKSFNENSLKRRENLKNNQLINDESISSRKAKETTSSQKKLLKLKNSVHDKSCHSSDYGFYEFSLHGPSNASTNGGSFHGDASNNGSQASSRNNKQSNDSLAF